MDAWAGFSDEDLRKVKTLANTNTQKTPQKSHGPAKRVSFAQDRLEKSSAKRSNPSSLSNTEHADIDPAMKLNKQPQENESLSSRHRIPKGEKEEHTNKESEVTDKRTEPETLEVTTEGQPTELDDKEALERDMISLEKFRTQQKAIEEANKQKKALLTKTLSERKQKAKKEAYKLEHIQKELSKLDNLLTADVQVIRNKIEDASRDFMEAQRRFEKAEAEYVSAKVDLHTKSELKEQLTEHLYTIIHQNEIRKAKKLADLMKELEMVNTEEEFHLPELPPLSSFQPSTTAISPTGSKVFINRFLSKESNEAAQTVSKHEAGDDKNQTVLEQDVGDGNKLTVSQEENGTVKNQTVSEISQNESHCHDNVDQPGDFVKDKENSNDEQVHKTDVQVGNPDETEETTKAPDDVINKNSIIESNADVVKDRKSQTPPICDLKSKVNDKVGNGETNKNSVEENVEKQVPKSWLFSLGKS